MACPKGHWCAQGAANPCGSGTYNAIEGGDSLSVCVQCPAESTSEQGSTSRDDCKCREGHYATSLDSSLSCVACPVGSTCAAIGVTLARLPLEPGYYRTSNASSDLRHCPDAAGNNSGCVGGVGNGEGPCREWLEGPYCTLCNVTDKSRYYDEDESACLLCTGDAAAPIVMGVGIALVVIVALLLWARFKPHRSVACS